MSSCRKPEIQNDLICLKSPKSIEFAIFKQTVVKNLCLFHVITTIQL